VTALQSSEGEGFIPFNAGPCSLFAAISYALSIGHRDVVLIGADMRIVNGVRHFFGEHPPGLRNTDPGKFIPDFERAAALLPADLRIRNATPASALTCFQPVTLEDL
jgi:hypothetical protein